jgi:hypothetical protein
VHAPAAQSGCLSPGVPDAIHNVVPCSNLYKTAAVELYDKVARSLEVCIMMLRSMNIPLSYACNGYGVLYAVLSCQRMSLPLGCMCDVTAECLPTLSLVLRGPCAQMTRVTVDC